MALGATDESQLVGIDAQFLVMGQPLYHTIANIVFLCWNTATKLGNRVRILVIGELICLPKLAMNLRISFNLHHLNSALEVGPQFCVGLVYWRSC